MHAPSTESVEPTRTGAVTDARWGVNLAHEAIDRHVVDGHGDREAMRFVDKAGAVTSLTYTELAARTDRMAGALRALGVRPGERVFLLAGRVPELYVAALGALKARAVVCPLFSAFGPEPIRQRMVLGDAAVLVTTSSLYRRKVAGVRDEIPSLRHVLLADAPADGGEGSIDGCESLHHLLATAEPLPPEVTEAEEPALLHFTSGTTGAPKGALHVHAAGAAHRDSAAFVFGLRAGDIYWCTADPGWVTGTSYGILGPLGCGATLVIDEAEFDAERWYGLLEEHGVQVWYTAPTAIRMLMRAGDELPRSFDLSALRFAASVGEPLDPGAVIWGRDVLGHVFHDTWWQSETGSIMIATSPDVEVRPGSMGKPVPWVEVGLLAADDEGDPVLDDSGRPVVLDDDPDTPGALAIRAGWPSMFRTYLGAPERYEACFLDGWYLSGDMARRDADGYYWFVGRADDVIKTAGHLIGPFEVEKALVEHPDVTAAGVYGVPDEVAGAVVHARIVLRSGVEDSDELRRDVMAHARRRLGPAVAPRDIGVVDTLPFTRSGKIMRRLLRARELGLPEGDLSTLETGPTATSSDTPSSGAAAAGPDTSAEEVPRG